MIRFPNGNSYSGCLEPYANQIITMYESGATTGDIAVLLSKYQQQEKKISPWAADVSPQIVRHLLMRAGKYPHNERSPLPLPDEVTALSTAEKLMLSIKHLPFAARPRNALITYEINTVNDLVRLTSFELLRIANFGKVCLIEVEAILAALGFHLADRVPPIMSNPGALNGAAVGQSTILCQCAAAERARIVAWLRHEADHGPVGGGPACRYVADLLERGS